MGNFYTTAEARRGDQPEVRTVWHTLNSSLTFLIFAALLIIIVRLFVPKLEERKGLEAEQERLKAERAKEQEVHSRQAQEINLLLNDPNYQETIARDKLDLMKDGEIILRMSPAE